MSKITHEKAREVMMRLESEDAYYGEYTEEHKIMASYINQQEKQDKLLDLYKKRGNLLEELYHNELLSLSLYKNDELKLEIKRIENQINEVKQ